MRVAVAGNPNVGKTSLFNVLTGSRHAVANYPGATVELREGSLDRKLADADVQLLDLPGTYSLTTQSEDEAVAFGALAGVGSPPPAAILLVLDASNLARNLYFALQVLELGRPTVVALNMTDVAAEAGLRVDAERLADLLGVPVVPTVARVGEGAKDVVGALIDIATTDPEPRFVEVSEATARVLRKIEDGVPHAEAAALRVDAARARWILTTAAAGNVETAELSLAERLNVRDLDGIEEAARELIVARYAEVDMILGELGHSEIVRDNAPVMTQSQRVDAVLTHPVLGLAAFVAVMSFIFISIFSWADPVMSAIEAGIVALSAAATDTLGPGLFTELVTEGLIAGVGNVLVFIPQIALLFLFLGLLEDSGYLARAAFLLDRLMARLGLHGRAFIPLLSGYACAIPAVLGTRSIGNWRDRFVTILMIPYMSCSARLPIYALIIGALFVSEQAWISPSVDRGLILLGMYALSTVSALVAGYIYKRTLLRSPTPPLVLELPPYRVPRVRNTLLVVYDRTLDFVRNAGTVILAFTIVLWAALSFPREDTGAGQGGPTVIERSYGGRVAKTLEPALAPIGQDWRIGVGLIGSFAAREVLVSTLGLVYGMEAEDDDPVQLREALRNDRDEETGKPKHTKLSGLALMIFFVYACQCMSTVAVVRRETRSWKWPAIMFFSMTSIAYVAALLVYQGGRLIGLE